MSVAYIHPWHKSGICQEPKEDPGLFFEPLSWSPSSPRFYPGTVVHTVSSRSSVSASLENLSEMLLLPTLTRWIRSSGGGTQQAVLLQALWVTCCPLKCLQQNDLRYFVRGWMAGTGQDSRSFWAQVYAADWRGLHLLTNILVPSPKCYWPSWMATPVSPGPSLSLGIFLAYSSSGYSSQMKYLFCC